MASSFRMHRRRSSLNAHDRTAILQNTIQTVQRLQVTLSRFEAESAWTHQLLTYLVRLSQCEPVETPEDQFNQVYILRKWLFWVPVSLLQRQGAQGPAMLTLAYFYAVAVTLEPLFPDLGSSFCAAIALPPLENIISITEAMRVEKSMDQSSVEVAAMMQFPQSAALYYRSRFAQTEQQAAPCDASFSGGTPDSLHYSNFGNLSPAFAPSPLHYGSSYQSSISPATPAFLEVPAPRTSFTHGSESWGPVPPPGYAPQGYALPEEQQSYGGMPMDGFRSGCVPPAPVWT